MKTLLYILSVSLLIFLPDFVFSQNSVIPKNGLVLALEQSNLENNKWTDYSEFKNDGFLYNNSQQKERVSGIESIKFNNFSDYISIKNSESLNPSQGITIIVWFKLNDLIPNQNIISKGYTSFQIPYVQYSLKMYDYSPFNTPQFNLSLNDKLNVLNGKTILTINKWYMIACTYDKSEMKMFVNNVQDEVSINRSENISSYPTNLELGRYPTAKSQHLNGNIGSVFLYNRGLTSIEIDQIWNSTKNNFGFIDEKQNNLIKGNGRIKLQDGRIYEGEFKYSENGGIIDSASIKREGEGTTFWKNSNVVSTKGTYLNNLLEGFGEYFREDGSKLYEGTWTLGKYNGKGKFLSPNGNVFYDGQFSDGRMEGFGKIYYENTNILRYVGFLKGNKPNGKGETYSSDGKLIYEGEHINGMREGIGKTYGSDGKITDEGKYLKDDLIEGTFYYSNGNPKYIGEFKEGKYDGYGKYFNENGSLSTEGFFKNGMNNGKGKTYYENGKIQYEGDFTNNQANGYGKYYGKDGVIIFEGEFLNGKNINKSTLSDKDSKNVQKDDFWGEFFGEKFEPKSSPTKIVDNSKTTEQSKNVEPSEYKNLSSFLKLLASSSSNTSTSSNSNSQSNSSSHSRKCSECKGSGKCTDYFNKGCMITRPVRYYNSNNVPMSRNEMRPGYIPHESCGGAGYKNYNGSYTYCEKYTGCMNGWKYCQLCNQGGSGKQLGVCKRCKGTGLN